MRKALIIFDGYGGAEPRIRNLISALRPNFLVTLAAYSTIENTDIEFCKLDPPLPPNDHWRYPTIIRRFISAITRAGYIIKEFLPSLFYTVHLRDKLFRSRYRLLKRYKFDLVACAHPWNIPLALKLSRKNKCPLVCDLYEYYPRQFDNNTGWLRTVGNYYDYLCRIYLQKVDLNIVAATGFGEEYIRVYGVDCIYYPCVTPFAQIEPHKTDMNKIRMIHHGTANPTRKIEEMIRLAQIIGRPFTLDLMLVPSKGNEGYLDELKCLASNIDNVSFKSPVSLDSIVGEISQYDIGLYMMPPTCFNQSVSTPNKLFEFIQARLALAIGPSKGMESIVSDYGVGVVSDAFDAESMARRLRTLTPLKVDQYKEASHVAATSLAAERWEKTMSTRLEELAAGYK